MATMNRPMTAAVARMSAFTRAGKMRPQFRGTSADQRTGRSAEQPIEPTCRFSHCRRGPLGKESLASGEARYS
jgi:hypothetical protein